MGMFLCSRPNEMGYKDTAVLEKGPMVIESWCLSESPWPSIGTQTFFQWCRAGQPASRTLLEWWFLLSNIYLTVQRQPTGLPFMCRKEQLRLEVSEQFFYAEMPFDKIVVWRQQQKSVSPLTFLISNGDNGVFAWGDVCSQLVLSTRKTKFWGQMAPTNHGVHVLGAS